MVRMIAVLGSTLLFASTPAFALMCNPKDVTARVLKSPNPNDIHPDWRDGSHLGTAWTLKATRRVQSETGTYLQGDLLSPRGGIINRGVFALMPEWDCST
jgi:hypothetical protein